MLYDICLWYVVDVWTLQFSVDSRYLATGSHNGKINLFSVEEGRKQTALDTRGKFIMSIAYVSDSAEYYHLDSFMLYHGTCVIYTTAKFQV